MKNMLLMSTIAGIAMAIPSSAPSQSTPGAGMMDAPATRQFGAAAPTASPSQGTGSTDPAVLDETLVPENPTDAAAQTPAVPDIATLGSTTRPAVSSSGTWNEMDDTSRYLMIMGSADGFSAAGPRSPCFPGRDNLRIDGQLKEAGFGASDSAGLADALAKISDPADRCVETPMRGYTVQLLKSMPEDHLALYLTGAVRAYAKVKGCDGDRQKAAAVAAATAIFKGADAVQPHAVLKPAFESACTAG